MAFEFANTQNIEYSLEAVLKSKIDNHSLFFAAQKKRTGIKSISAKLFFLNKNQRFLFKKIASH